MGLDAIFVLWILSFNNLSLITYFSKGDILDVQKAHEKMMNVTIQDHNYLNITTLREMQIKTTMNYYPILIRMAIIKKSTNKCWRGCGKKGTLLPCWWEGKLVEPLWRIIWRFFKNLKIEWPCDPEIQLLGIYLEKTILWKDIGIPVFTEALFTIAKTRKQPKYLSKKD